jgi:hypothetical protein
LEEIEKLKNAEFDADYKAFEKRCLKFKVKDKNGKILYIPSFSS